MKAEKRTNRLKKVKEMLEEQEWLRKKLIVSFGGRIWYDEESSSTREAGDFC